MVSPTTFFKMSRCRISSKARRFFVKLKINHTISSKHLQISKHLQTPNGNDWATAESGLNHGNHAAVNLRIISNRWVALDLRRSTSVTNPRQDPTWSSSDEISDVRCCLWFNSVPQYGCEYFVLFMLHCANWTMQSSSCANVWSVMPCLDLPLQTVLCGRVDFGWFGLTPPNRITVQVQLEIGHVSGYFTMSYRHDTEILCSKHNG